MTQQRHPRRIKLIRPRLQLRLIGWFLGVSTLALLLQYLLFGWFVNDLALTLTSGGAEFATAANSKLMRALLLSFLFLLPMSLTVGVLVTFRIAGPVYRFETYLGQIARGEEMGPCRIREGDELRDLCLRINLAVEALRKQRSEALEQAREAAPARRSA